MSDPGAAEAGPEQPRLQGSAFSCTAKGQGHWGPPVTPELHHVPPVILRASWETEWN